MRRLLVLLMMGLALAASPALPQSRSGQSTYRLGVLTLSGGSAERIRVISAPELAAQGFALGRNLVIDTRLGGPEQQARLASDLLAAGPPDAIVAIGTEALRAARMATTSVPIVALGTDAVDEGFAATLAHPGANVTGLTILGPQLDGKRVELLHEAVPAAKKIAALHRSSSLASAASLEAMRSVAANAGIELLAFDAGGPEDYPAAFAAMRSSAAQALIIASHPEFFRDAGTLSVLSIEARLPTVCQWAEMARSGCLIGYGPSLTELYRLAARYVARIFRGTPPGELPIEQPTTFELAINLRTAKALGLTVPQSFLARADEVIE